MVKHPCYVEVSDMIEFSRLVCALERIPRTVFSFALDGKDVICVQMDLLKERPVSYYVQNTKVGHYLSYGFKTNKEDCDVVNTITNPTYLYSPIIRVKSLPESLKPETAEPEVMYEPLELEDLASLIKLSYGFEESPFPLFAFSDGTKWFVGVFMNFNESDEASYFCHVKIDYEPAKPFLKYSSKDGIEPSFVSGLNEHGYSYLKVIKLKGKHPLVKL
ncbi:MAG: hypothetical protein KGH89_08040 [Thaumarchaeota archaeon]|nr:hypothetical protein [Nitrososphaerota archaeon]